MACFVVVACGPDTEEVDRIVDVASEPQALAGGIDVPPATIRKTGAVMLSGPIGSCSGTLITPVLVLTAAHCQLAPGNDVRFGNLSSPPDAQVTAVFTHPSWNDGACDAYDAAIVRLNTPLWVERDDGTLWEFYRRDLYRGSLSALQGSHVDVYAYGGIQSGGGGWGTLRFAAFDVQSVGTYVEIDSIVDEYVYEGDSGGAVLTPSHGVPGAFDDYRIAGVLSCRWWAPFDHFGRAARADYITPWFDTVVAEEWDDFWAPAQISVVSSLVLF